MSSLTRSIDEGLGSWPWRRARIDGDAVVFADADAATTVTYAALASEVDRLAHWFAARGVGAGDRVAYLGDNHVHVFRVMFAAARLGAVFVPLNTRWAAPEVAYALEDGVPRLLVHGPEQSELVARAAPTSLTTLDHEEIQDALAHQPRVEVEALPGARFGDPALIIYTSGTTGRPKGAVLTHRNVTWNTFNQLAHLDLVSTDVTLWAAPLFHVTGLGQVTMPTLYKGGTVVPVAKFEPATYLGLIERHRATAFSAVPTMLQMLCDDPAWDSTDLSSLRIVNYGGSSVLERVARAWLDRGVLLQQGYGQTEAAPGIFMATRQGALAHPVSCGVPHFWTETALADIDGRPVPAEGRGELLVRGPHVFAGYWNAPAATAATLTDDGWLRTGDVVEIDSDGWANVVDRVKDVFISGGENVYPAEVEAAIAEVDGVTSVALVGVPDERWGEVGYAYVTTDSGISVHPEAILDHLNGRLARFKIPRRIEIVEHLPRNATGKILRAQLRDQARHVPTTHEGKHL